MDSIKYIEEEHEVEAGRSAAQKNKNRSPPVSSEHRKSSQAHHNTESSSLLDHSAREGSISGSDTSLNYDSETSFHLDPLDKIIKNQIKERSSDRKSLQEMEIRNSRLEQEELRTISLHQLARDGDAIRIRRILDNVEVKAMIRLVNRKDEDQLAPLHYAARYNHMGVVQMLVERKADVNSAGEEGITPLHFAARYKRTTAQGGITRARKTSTTSQSVLPNSERINRPFDDVPPSATTSTHRKKRHDKESSLRNASSEAATSSAMNIRGVSSARPLSPSALKSLKQSVEEPLEKTDETGRKRRRSETISVGLRAELSAQNGIISYLVSASADPNAQDNYGMTPLHYAAMRGNEVIASELLKCQAKFELVDHQKMTALHTACAHGSQSVVELLLKNGADPRVKDFQLHTPMHLAAHDGHVQIIHLLFEVIWIKFGVEAATAALEEEDTAKNTPLRLAVNSGRVEAVNFLLKMGSNPNTLRLAENTPLHSACNIGNLAIVQSLVEKGARLDAINGENQAPLHRASTYDHHLIIKYLLEKGANVDARDRDGLTPLLIAVSDDHVESATVLIRKGARVVAAEKNDRTALFLAAQFKCLNALQFLLSCPLPLPADQSSIPPEELVERKRLEAASDAFHGLINKPDRYNNTPLHIAAQNGFVTICKELLDNGASIVMKNDEEQTPLHLAAKKGRTRVVREFVRRNKLIIAEEDEKSNTPLHIAASQGHEMAVKDLITAGANVLARNNIEWTPLDCAAANGWAITVGILLDHGSQIDPCDKRRTTPLHLASSHGHVNVVKLLLKRGAAIGSVDYQGRNCLDLAIENNHKEVAYAIVADKNYKDALRNVTMEGVIGAQIRDTPLRKLIRRLPDVAVAVLNRCTRTDEQPEHDNYSIRFNYEFIDDTYVAGGDKDDDGSPSKQSGKVFNDNGKLKDNTHPYSTNPDLIIENHPIQMMVDCERVLLLSHPLTMSLLRHKWNSYGRFVYYSSLALYVIFLSLLTAYIIMTPAPFNVEGRDVSLLISANETCSDIKVEQSSVALLCKVGIMILTIIQLVKECYQCYQRRWSYLSWENLIEWVVYITAIIFVIDYSECTASTGLRHQWQWELGSVCVFLAWINLVLMIRKFPRFGIYVVMFTDILKTFSRFFLVFVLFVTAFAMGFFVLFQNRPSFSNVRISMMKTSVMMVGELDFDGLFSNPSTEHSETTFNRPFAYALFMFFLIVMTILLMNLLIGLAVDDIKAVQEKAVLKRLAMQVELVLHVERALPDKARRRYMLGRQKLFPNQRSVLKNIRRFFMGDDDTAQLNVNTISNHLNQELSEMAQVKLNQERFGKELDDVGSRLNGIGVQQRRLHSMMTAVMGHLKVNWEDQDEFQ